MKNFLFTRRVMIKTFFMISEDMDSKTKVSNRRQFLKTGAALGAAVALPSFTMRAAANKNSNLRILHIGVGGIGGMQRGNLKNHA